MSNQNQNKDRIIIVTGFALFLFGIIANAVFTLKFDELNKEIIGPIKLCLIIALFSLIIAITCGAALYLERRYDLRKIEDILLFSLCVALASIMGILAFMITELPVYVIIFGILTIGAIWYVERHCRVE